LFFLRSCFCHLPPFTYLTDPTDRTDPTDLTDLTDKTKVAIIGAGVSGLAAAVRLAHAGLTNITLFEARREAGGRTRSYTDPHTGDTLDNGQHLLMGCYTATLEYMRAIGTEKLIDRTPLRIPFWSESGVRSFTIDRSLGPPLNLLSAVARTSLLTLSEKRAAAVLGNAVWRAKLPDGFSDMTCAELFHKLAQPDSLVTKLWAPIVLATINATPERASAELFVNVLREAFFSSRSASMLLIPKCGLSELLIDPAVRGLTDKRVILRLGTPVRKIEVNNNKIEIQLDGEVLHFDAVISSIPHLISDTRYRTPDPSPIVNAYFWLDRSVLKAPVHAFIGTTLQWAFPKASKYSAERLALTVSAAENLSTLDNESIRDMLWTELKHIVPATREATLVHYQIIREKRATPLFTPQTQSNRPKTATTVAGLYLAGDLVQNGLPATIEGAIRNGHAAANALIEASKEGVGK
jgi:squalene-associated FAD-dependent desaturase